MLKEKLSKTTLAKAATYKRWQDSQAYIIGKYLLSIALNRYGFRAIDFEDLHYTEYGRPYLPKAPDFNISHAGQYVVCAVSKNYRVGIDIENIHAINEYDFTEQFSQMEMASIVRANSPPTKFFKYWTMKEAVVKADGRGLSIPLKNISVENNPVILDGNTWFVYGFDVNEGYVGHLAINVSVNEALIPEEIYLPR